MKNFVIKTLVNAAAIWVAAWIVTGITLSGDDWQHKALTVIGVALVFGVINFLIKPLVKLFSLPLFFLTLGLITFVINALMLWLTSWASDKLSLDFHVEGFWSALLGALIISLVSWGLNLALKED
ncbi:phage holin family protein [Kitasatospora cineracea]|uniref:phage holin family protein n=1 Tax=Kitasatospora TaxID=2063 RepID=UPI0004BD73DC|nr:MULTISPECIES: phage holin family protein [unclassified Kitasatospora]WAL72968.1 phage holin family protein [Kitasatospora sp. YST-16]WNW39017.1 phage holin family protein [Streptomyces sp. Li-HN-5-13]